VAVYCLSHSNFISYRLCGLSYVAIVSSSKWSMSWMLGLYHSWSVKEKAEIGRS